MSIKLTSIVLLIMLTFFNLMFAGQIIIENPDALRFQVTLLDPAKRGRTINVLGSSPPPQEDYDSKLYDKIKITAEKDFSNPPLPVFIGKTLSIHKHQWKLSSKKDAIGNITITVTKEKPAQAPQPLH